MTASCPVVCGCASLSVRSAKVPSSLPGMQTNKSRKAPGWDFTGSAQAGATAGDADPVPQEEDNVGDSEIIKSPSDPKQYR